MDLKDFFRSSLIEEDIDFLWVENVVVLKQIYRYFSLSDTFMTTRRAEDISIPLTTVVHNTTNESVV
jgi:hypothetical protein